MSTGKKLTIFMINGDEYGPRTAEIGNWTGKAIYSQRVNIENILGREEFDKPAVYVLKSYPEKAAYTDRVYIGQTTNLRNRLTDHINNDKDNWTEFIAFVSNDDLLTPSTTMYLESRLIRLTLETDIAEVSNEKRPSPPKLAESDLAVMDEFLEQIKLILPLMGFRFLIRGVVKVHEVGQSSNQVLGSSEFNIASKDVDAKMVITEEGYIVLSGSYASGTVTSSLGDGYKKLRESLIAKGSLQIEGKYLVFREDVIFSSSSAAGSVVLGRQVAGPLVWKEIRTNTKLKEIME